MRNAQERAGCVPKAMDNSSIVRPHDAAAVGLMARFSPRARALMILGAAGL